MFDENYLRYQIKKRSWLRKFIRNIFLKHTIKYIYGKTIDFGCGPGELLSKLAEGSIGLEINPEAVMFCKANKLNVDLYHPDIDDYKFMDYKGKSFKTFIISHVLEHIDNADIVLKKILDSCSDLKVERIIVIVPGIKGFKSDITHKTFIDYDFIIKNHFKNHDYYRINSVEWFPFNCNAMGKIFLYNEMMVVYDKK